MIEDTELESRRMLFSLESKNLFNEIKQAIKQENIAIAYEKVNKAEKIFLQCLEETKFLLTESSARFTYQMKGNYGKYPW